VTDYAANSMLIGSGINTALVNGSPNFDNNNWTSGPPSHWNSYHRRMTSIKDGTANTIMLGTKALAVQVYNNRGCSNFSESSDPGKTQSCNDDPITNPGPGLQGTLRAFSPDDLWYIASNDSQSVPFPGAAFHISGGPSGWASWYPFTFAVVRDTVDLDSFNRWGAPYSGACPMVMCDASVRNFNYNVSNATVLALCTPSGSEVVDVP
jgi:hypothetical protein